MCEKITAVHFEADPTKDGLDMLAIGAFSLHAIIIVVLSCFGSCHFLMAPSHL